VIPAGARPRWRVALVVLAVAVALVAALPALALVEKSGSQNCGANNVAVRSYANGSQVLHYAPTGTQIGSFNNGGNWTVRTSATSLTSTSWKVTSNQSLNSPGTYAYCWGT